MDNQFQKIINTFKKKTILTIGDAMLDGYFEGETDRICREAPVPIVDIRRKLYAPGGAANTAVNVAKLSAKSFLLTVIGSDTDGLILRKELERKSVDTNYLLIDHSRETLAKKRILANAQMLVRFDSGIREPLEENIEDQFIEKLLILWEKVDGVIISDYGYGVLSENIIHTIAKLQTTSPRPLIIDSKYLDRFFEIPATALKPNYKEALSLLGLTKTEYHDQRIPQIIKHKDAIFERVNAEYVTITLDENGSLLFGRDGSLYRTYADQIEYPKVAGAGDTYTAALSLAFAADADYKTAAEIASKATSVTIKKEGTAYCSIEELLEAFVAKDKYVIDRTVLTEIIRAYKKQGKKIVFTNGCFDILHSGHVKYLNKAKEYGDILIVGLNTDESIKKLKGPKRPINTLSDRMQVLSGLSSVNYVVSMPEDTAETLVKLVRPDVYVKGGDYTIDTLPEARHVLAYGGKVELVPTVEGKSTTSIIKRIQQPGTVQAIL